MGFRANLRITIFVTGIGLGLLWLLAPLNTGIKRIPIAQISGLVAALTYLSGAALIIWKNMKKEEFPHHLIRIIYTISNLMVFVIVAYMAFQWGFDFGCVIMSLPPLLLLLLIWLPEEEFESGEA